MRTPFCGKPGCEWPPQKPRPAGAELVKQIVGEISAMEYAGDCQAIAAVIIDRDGDVRTLIAYSEGSRIQLMGGAAILQLEVAGKMRAFEKVRD